jgi:hypothetical protein
MHKIIEAHEIIASIWRMTFGIDVPHQMFHLTDSVRTLAVQLGIPLEGQTRIAKAAKDTPKQYFTKASHDIWKLATVAEPGSTVALVMRGMDAIPSYFIEIALLARLMSHLTVGVFVMESIDATKGPARGLVPSSDPKVGYRCFLLSDMLRGVSEISMENFYTTSPKINTKSSTTEESTSKNQISEVLGGHESATIPIMASLVDGSIGQRNHRVQKPVNKDELIIQESEVSERGVSGPRVERATVFEQSGSGTKASNREELQCGLRSCPGNNTSGDTTGGFPLVWDWLRHGMQHLRDYDLLDIYSNATLWFPWRHWGMRFCTDSKDDDIVIQPEDWREFTNLLKLDSYDQSQAPHGRYYTCTAPVCVSGFRRHYDFPHLWLHYHVFHGPHFLRIGRDAQAELSANSKYFPKWLEQLDQNVHFKTNFRDSNYNSSFISSWTVAKPPARSDEHLATERTNLPAPAPEKPFQTPLVEQTSCPIRKASRMGFHRSCKACVKAKRKCVMIAEDQSGG